MEGVIKLFCLLCLVQLGRCVEVTLENSATGELKKEIKLATRATLQCTPTPETSNPPTVQWYYQKDKASSSDGKFVVHDNELLEGFQDSFEYQSPANLIFKNTTKQDSGKYKCRAEVPQDNNGNDYGVYDVTIVYPPSKPFCSYPSDKVLTRGFEQDLKCVSEEGVPDAMYTWYKDGKPLPTESSKDSKYKNGSFSYQKSVGTLRFLEVNDANAGLYYCNASNSQGWSQCNEFKLTIQDQNVGQIVGIVFGVIIALALVCLVVFWLWKKGYLSGGNDKDEDYMYDMAEEGNNDVMLDGEGPHLAKAPSDVGSVRPESSMMI